jgi:hypothetical protein
MVFRLKFTVEQRNKMVISIMYQKLKILFGVWFCGDYVQTRRNFDLGERCVVDNDYQSTGST